MCAKKTCERREESPGAPSRRDAWGENTGSSLGPPGALNGNRGHGAGPASALVLVTALATLLASVPVLCQSGGEYQTLFYEEFDTDQPQAMLIPGGCGSLTVVDGYAFLNITDRVPGDAGPTDEDGCFAMIWATLDDTAGNRGRWLYTSLEIRLRCSDDNKLNSDTGGGLRYWGWNDAYSYPPNKIFIQSWSPESVHGLVFEGCVDINDSTTYSTDLSQVDMREWHTYTILWEPDGVEFLVDGEVVGATDQSPSVPMFPIMNLWNLLDTADLSRYIAVEHSYLQVDYIKCFVPVERFEAWSQEMSSLISQATGMIEDLEEKGFPGAKTREELLENWRDGNYDYCLAKPHMEELIDTLAPCLDHADEINGLFAQASACIETFVQAGDTRNEKMCTAFYTQAQGTWEERDVVATRSVLNNIMSKCPEPVLASLLGLLVLPLLCRRKGWNQSR